MSKVIYTPGATIHNKSTKNKIPSPLIGRTDTISNENNSRSVLGRYCTAIVAAGNFYYLSADGSNFRGILKFDPTATIALTVVAGSSTAGSADGVGAAAQFNNPTGIAYNSVENAVYIIDRGNNKIRRMDCATLNVTTVIGSGTQASVDGTGTAAQLRIPYGIVIDEAAQVGYFTESAAGSAVSNKLRQFTIPGYVVTTLNTTSPNVNMQFYDVKMLKGLTGSGQNYLYIAASTGILQRTVGVNAPTTLIQTIPNTTLGYLDGAFATAQFNSARWLAISQADQTLYVTEATGNRVRRVQLGLPTANTGVTTVAGDIAASAGASGFVNALGSSARFNTPLGIIVANDGSLLVCDNLNSAIRRIE